MGAPIHRKGRIMTETEQDPQSWADGKMLSSRIGAVGIMTFNHPERLNAVSMEMWEAMGEIMTGFGADDSIRVIVLRGAGDKAFVSGGDISQFAKTRASAAVARAHTARIAVGRNAVANCAKPTIACIRGFCLGGGLAIAVQADLRLAATGSQFGIPAARLGVAYGFEGLRTLVDLVGPAHARMIMYAAERIDAAEAARIGLINRVLAPDALWPQVMALAERIADNAPISIAAAKDGIAQVLRDPADRDLPRLKEYERQSLDSEDFKEGRTAFMEKRRPRFVGR
jgi:enoyl-CoA hydratase